MRRPIVGVFGGTAQPDDAFAFGYEIAKAGLILLTGGRPIAGPETKNAAMRGAAEAQARGEGILRAIGILDSREVDWDTSLPGTVILSTGLTSWERDAINGVTVDAAVALIGDTGTLTELAYAALVGRRVFFCRSLDALRRKCDEHRRAGTLHAAFAEASSAYPNVEDVSAGVDALDRAVTALLGDARDDAQETPATIVRRAADAARTRDADTVAFPGLPHDPAAAAHFTSFLAAMSG